ncbi:MAG TPA: exonuclease domain-containing protein [Candidatus Paceibacterota bacterium]
MTNILFLDTETTGLENGRLIQLAYKKRGDGIFVEYYKPPVAIEFEAMGTHHITEKMVADKLPFAETETYKTLPELLQNSILVAHNARYDIGILETEGIKAGKWICTYKVAYRMYDYPNHKMQSLRYRWGIEIPDAVAHDAAGDVMVLEEVFEHMLKGYCAEHGVTEEKAIEEFIKISAEPALLKTMPMGKYRGMTFQEVVKKDRDYLLWMRDKMENKTEDLIHTLQHHLA